MICPHITESDYKRRFEGNINDWQEPTHTKECRNDIDFFAEYAPRMEAEVNVIPGMPEIIKQFAQSYMLIIISSTITAPIQQFIKKHNLAMYFTEVMGNDIHASKAEKIKMVFSKYGTDSAKCLFITDTLGDIKEATGVGVAAIGVTWGFQDKKTLLKGNPLFIAEKPEELPSIVSNYFQD